MLNIRKNSFLFFVSCLFLIVISSCSKDDEDEPRDYTIKLSTYEITFQSEGGSRSVSLESEGSISSAYSSASWISVEHYGGSSITISALPNNQTTTRTGTVEVTNEYGRSAIIDIMQSGSNNSGGGNVSPGEDKINVPTNVKAVQTGNTIVVTWDAVPGASRYEVFHASSANGTYSSYGHWTSNRYVDEAVLVTDNYYKIRAVGSTVSELSAYAYCKYSANGGSQKPSVPTGLRAVQSGESIVVSWNSVPNVYYYRLWYSNPSGQENFTNVYAPTTTCVFDQYMKNGTYKFWIQAVNADYEESNKSSIVSCTFNSSGGGGGGSNTPSKLDTPKNVEAYSDTYFVQISCDEVPLAYQYELYRSSYPNSGYTKISASGGSTASGRYCLTDSHPKSGTTYYKVKAVALSYLGIKDSDLSTYVKVVR